MTKPLQGRVALVTGASRGIGRAAALAYAEAGAHVVALARTTGALEELDDEIRAVGGSATLVPADLADAGAIEKLGPALLQRWGKLDIMLANAGILGPLAPLTHASPKEWAQVFDINVSANWRLLKSVEPALQASDAGRVILLSSGAAHKCMAYWGPYSISKAAVEAMARTYANETSTSPLRVMLVNPGPLRTRMRAQAMPGEDPQTLRTPEDLAPHLVKLASPDWTETGKIFDFPQGKVLTPQMPA
ncbi:SDR family NAD(P)-dependent oxidoreductase [Bosea sp. (in: a-proteobacteria)]|jgi:NAD(P)-dependent dehydrogenase (short-subunit alcohol dehydrogenase family)|uniref:SDR family NAD(P)-dependent oxidoreductase n=1 Tax=Bosea sp. (in: a-proteobacteria) TaxID=1871050 RepID=UPI001AC2571E|nr:SDR family NAD(P)-dependent oxidoreductase [Bosea sp. (in: a-proteobacteria)]MBN9439432.1 SDR family NAD(P)-dependent oxidoreductase [Bosea sp. (in: a-proteobacteria)]